MDSGDRKFATLLNNGVKHPPVLTSGTLTPETLQQFQIACQHHFNYRKVAEADKVTTIAPSLQSPTVQLWYFGNEATLTTGTFVEFMTAFRKRFLKKNWADNIRVKLLRSSQSEDDSFDTWLESLEASNALLIGTTSFFSDKRLREHIESHAFEDLRTLAETAEVMGLTDFQEFKEALSEADSKRRVDRAKRKREIENVLAARSRFSVPSSSSRPAPTSGSAILNNGPSAGANANSLTEAERKLLEQTKGCLKCRKLNAGHFARACPDGFPNPVGYRNLVTGKAVVAAFVEVTSDTGDDVADIPHIAAIKPAIPSSVLTSNNEDWDSDKYVRTPLTLPHIVWTARLHSPSSLEEPTEMLIDSGCTTVLIREDVVKQHNLRRCPLHKPFQYRAAFGSEIRSSSEKCRIRVSTSDFSWSSLSVDAIIVPDLCSPVILGLPFYSRNKLLIDVAHRTLICMDGRDLLQPTPPCDNDSRSEHQRRYDARQAEHDRKQLEQETIMLERMMHETQCKDMTFHTDVYHRFKLKDPNAVIARRQYECPKKYREAWKTLLQQHLDARRIRPSCSPYASPAFLIPKHDTTVLPRWVNDYRMLNANTVPDVHPLPSIAEILSDCDGIQADNAKVEKILDWPVPRSASEVRAFLGLVRYISNFLPALSCHTLVLNTLTTKEADKQFLWTPAHFEAFEAIKTLVTSRKCLTVIDHMNLGNNRVFVSCDASDLCTGAILSYGETPETARPVAFKSQQLSGAELNYPVHEKELLAIVRALRKWRVDLLGIPFTIFSDHRTLENFTEQKHLSRRQARWQEFMSQYDYTITYIAGADNTPADAMSRKPSITPPAAVAATSALEIRCDSAWISSVKAGYALDSWCSRLLDSLWDPVAQAAIGTDAAGISALDALGRGWLDERDRNGISVRLGMLYVGQRLIVPRIGSLREDVFKLAHNTLGHWGGEKSYGASELATTGLTCERN
ncbi:hypothetical protein EW026_g7473 [Hermanssonia centrifuga]|uniref:RNA-directed DNA polymerase n=1 Tax=Hermanssonia centrifuga TaxID=98765 RepID=A0A4S4K8S8_9APHY|nr:hypothetical protein EW026_g7473 [Hermanssonia centrifuga]